MQPSLPVWCMSSSVRTLQKEDIWRCLPADRWTSRAVVPLKGQYAEFHLQLSSQRATVSYPAQSFPHREASQNSQIELFSPSFFPHFSLAVIRTNVDCISCAFFLCSCLYCSVQKKIISLYIESLLDLISEWLSSDSVSHFFFLPTTGIQEHYFIFPWVSFLFPQLLNSTRATVLKVKGW